MRNPKSKIQNLKSPAASPRLRVPASAPVTTEVVTTRSPRRVPASIAAASLSLLSLALAAGCGAKLPDRKGLVAEDRKYVMVEAQPWSPVVGDLDGLRPGVGGAVVMGQGSSFGEKEMYFAGAWHDAEAPGDEAVWLRLGLRMRAALYNARQWNLHYRVGLEGHAVLPDSGPGDYGLGLVIGAGAQGRVPPFIWSAGAGAHPFWIDGQWGALFVIELGAGMEF